MIRFFRTYGPSYTTTTEAPTTTTTTAPYQPTTRVYRPISAYKQATEAPPGQHEADESAPPTYDPANVKKRRMKYVNRLQASAAEKSSGSLFYGAVKGRVRAPQRGASRYEN